VPAEAPVPLAAGAVQANQYPPLASAGANPAAPCLGHAPASPEPGAQRRPLAAAVEPAHRHSRPPKSGANQPLGTPRALPHPSPAASTGELAGIELELRRTVMRATLRGSLYFRGPSRKERAFM
jgi:hypothetical protein